MTRILTPADYVRMPWKNGGGTTTELVKGPEEGGRFLYRVSIADVSADGPFSRFEGYDRHIMLIAGQGMTLGSHVLSPLEPYSFSGDDDVAGTLTRGPVRDFNLIVDRARAKGQLATRQLARGERVTFDALGTCIVHVLAGALDVARLGQTLVLDAALPTELTVVAREAATLVVARVAR